MPKNLENFINLIGHDYQLFLQYPSQGTRMKREGKQHGMVRSYPILPSPLNPRPNTRFITRFESPSTAGLFVKVSSKPTNHSKFTSKCGTPRCTGCHLHPACKSKHKTKGTQKHKYWKVLVDQLNSDFIGLPKPLTLDHLFDDSSEDESGGGGDHHVNYLGTFDNCNWEKKDGEFDDKYNSTMCVSLQIDQVEVEKDNDERLDFGGIVFSIAVCFTGSDKVF
ncbi:hypothetical protein Fmac_011363 [Flemingia macrophylla]|uniref:Uncharacterized protein n=1 Tax=Flemingia macrophylla TaxID=520843 RepID=A0ABD1MN12_9FABA